MLLILKLCVWVSFFILCMLSCLHFKYFFLLGTPYPSHIPLPLWGCYVIHPSTPGIPLLQGNEHPQAQGPLLPLMSNKAIFCHICTQSHGSLHVYSLVGGPVPGSSWESGQLTLLLLHGAANPLSSFSPFSNSSIRSPHAPSNGCLWASSSVFVRLWQSHLCW